MFSHNLCVMNDFYVLCIDLLVKGDIFVKFANRNLTNTIIWL